VVVRAKSHRPETLKEGLVLRKIFLSEKVCWRAKQTNRTTTCGRAVKLHPPTHPPTQTNTDTHTHARTHTHTHTAIDKVGRVESTCWCKEQSYVYCQSRKTGYAMLALTHHACTPACTLACTPACTPARTHACTRSHDIYVYM
jgi:hypothetical protein